MLEEVLDVLTEVGAADGAGSERLMVQFEELSNYRRTEKLSIAIISHLAFACGYLKLM